ncbi:hypothetical protein [Spirosoma radiotolerans]|uniref:Uncharacterized protein n=1 Tax=Spirosoma radiotolerans TaxID=1379870 RepID=A0A0E3ZTC6_9BACT|nr:hypothetical protein [Spirosoma radiotolerans]AKD54873.1 hypothetical protein SD10_08130 [Spirosoma radiotolerans]
MANYTLGRSRAALRTGLFHLSFNRLSILMGLLLIAPFTQLILWVSAGATPERQLANAPVLFNVLSVPAVAGFVPFLAKRLEHGLPDRAEPATAITE